MLLKLLYEKTFERRGYLAIFTNIFITIISYVLALGLRLDFDYSQLDFYQIIIFPLLLLLLLRSFAYSYLNMNNGFWRYVSIYDLVSLVKVHFYSSGFFIAALFLTPFANYPFSVPLIEFFLSLVIAGGVRFFVRIMCEKHKKYERKKVNEERCGAVILGVGDSAHFLIKALLANPLGKLVPVAILDDNVRLRGVVLHGVKVMGTLDYLGTLLRKFPNVSMVICTIPNLSPSRALILKEFCHKLGVSFRNIQSVEDIAISTSLLGIEVESFIIESILEKEGDVPHEAELNNALLGKDVLVTGAGGSIGSELVRQIIHFKPNSVVALDSSEFNIYALHRELSDKGLLGNMKFVLASVTDKKRLYRVFKEYKPEIVFHAAAYKHVSIMEGAPYEAFTNNVLGTRNVLEVCNELKVEHFSLISSDKAVAPTSVMGATKRIAEYLVREMSDKNDLLRPSPHYSIVRFGNVINSTGSVIPLFKNQIESGMPITITHPEMERFFMTTREAVRLVLIAGVLGANGEVYVLDMGKSIKIVEIAEKMRALYGRKDLPIVFTGMRAGEKLKELLFHPDEVLAKTNFDKVMLAKNDRIDGRPVSTRKWIEELEKVLSKIDEHELGNLLLAHANEIDVYTQNDLVFRI